MNKHVTMDLFYTLLDSHHILEVEKDTLFRKHNNLFIQIGKCLIHFHIYSLSYYEEPLLKIMIVDPFTFTHLHTFHPSFYHLLMIHSTTLYDFQKIIQEIQKIRKLLFY